MRALDVYTAVVEALGRAGVYVILDNHMRCGRAPDHHTTDLNAYRPWPTPPARPPRCHSDADWCCTPLDENGLWFNKRYSEATFFEHWEYMVARHRNYSHVVAAELRNELRRSCGLVDDDGNPYCACVRAPGRRPGSCAAALTSRAATRLSLPSCCAACPTGRGRPPRHGTGPRPRRATASSP